MPARRISFVNFKGGVGKTSLAVNIAACLAHNLSQRVLLIDCDVQSNASIWLMGVPRWDIINNVRGKSIYGAFLPNLPPLANNIIPSVIQSSNGFRLIPTLDLLPATYELMDLEQEYQDGDGEPFYYRFYEHLRSVIDQYDYIIFDCPPNALRACRCAIFASQEIYVPCNQDTLSLIGLSLLIRKIEQFHNHTVIQQRMIRDYQPAKIRGIVLNAVSATANFDLTERLIRLKIQEARVRKVVSDDADILSQQIRRAVQASHVVALNLPATLDKGKSALKEEYINLTRYIHNSSLNRRAEIDGIERKNVTARQAARRASKA
ncbi:MAG: ParA family protein [Blastocatellia bacterium]|nr:ParA family protein [Blastocatellia bacterium]